MNYNQLVAGFQYYNENYRHWVSSYRRLRSRGNEYWLHLERLNESEVRREIVGFLNDWKCRVDYKSTGSLKLALDSVAPFYAVLEGETIEDIDFAESKSIRNQRFSNSNVIQRIARCFLRVRPKFGPVAASKLMHMAIPGLFVMWDTGIRSKYRLPTHYAVEHTRQYVRFLRLMQMQIMHAIKDHAEINSVNARTSLQQIRKEDDHTTLPRIVDKHNFAIRDGKLRICTECYNRWLHLTS